MYGFRAAGQRCGPCSTGRRRTRYAILWRTSRGGSKTEEHRQGTGGVCSWSIIMSRSRRALNTHRERKTDPPDYLIARVRSLAFDPMPVFDIVVVGSGGGLDETNLSAYVVPCSTTSFFSSHATQVFGKTVQRLLGRWHCRARSRCVPPR